MLHISKDQGQLILELEFLEIWVNDSHKLLMSNWQGWLDTNRGKSGCLQIVEQVKKHSIKKILNDNSKVTGHSGETKWLADVWLPALREAGVTHFAWVYPQEFFTQLEIDNTVDKSSGIAIRTFFLKDDARQWLLLN